MTEWTTNVVQVTIRAAGDVDGRVDVSNVGTPEAVVSLTIGSSLCRLVSRVTTRKVRENWERAGINTNRLPERVSQTWLGPDLGIAPVGAVVKLVDPPVASHLVPRNDQHRRPVHLAIQVGPVVWVVLDRTAYRTMLDLWRRAERAFG
ncbi:hypothetical protein SAMN04487819_11681 [Actinopolyspora alba]|uniref:Uncharacterized protein n=1 Tax=Actinopolyspora alba TaxID=673379 RepID=A0A1I2BGH3_9ACTN|nr:hypothetical protein [Actinopolyspora alba]SFE54948.1 hypothetical protein SAMN04487819_11681 [Actinopolyspora alba]